MQASSSTFCSSCILFSLFFLVYFYFGTKTTIFLKFFFFCFAHFVANEMKQIKSNNNKFLKLNMFNSQQEGLCGSLHFNRSK